MIEIGDRIKGEIRFNRSGSAYLVSDETPKDIYIHKSKTNSALHLDHVEVEVVEGNGRAIEGVVTEVIKRNKLEFVGTVQLSEKYAFVVLDNNKITVDFFVPLKHINGAEHGQKVLVKLTKWNSGDKNPNGKIIEIFGYAGDNDTEVSAILHEYDLVSKFTDEVLDEVNKLSSEFDETELNKRRDFRDTLTFTIDPETAKDFDDALSVKHLDDDLIEVGIHIADVTHYLRPGTDLDNEAYERGTSIYMVDRTIPMLPERLSNDLCSLNPNENKYTFSAVFTLNGNGDIIDKWFGKTVIYSDRRFTYKEAQDIIEKNIDDYEDRFDIGINVLNNIAKKLRRKRTRYGSINFNKQEVGFILDENKKAIDIKIKETLDSNKLIEEFMLLANMEVAKKIKLAGIGCVNRAHESPDILKLESIRDYAYKFGYKVDFSTPDKIRDSLNKILKDSEGKPEGNIISTLILKCMQKAVYTTKNIGHYGLNFEDYSHFTSPIRRYPDVLTHRILYRLLNGKTPIKTDKLEGRCQYLSKMERTAKKAERDSIKFKQVEYLENKIGFLYSGIVSGMLDSGIFVEIIENKCEGYINLKNISGDEYKVDSENYRIVGTNTGDVISLGDKVHVTISSVNPELREINMNLIRM